MSTNLTRKAISFTGEWPDRFTELAERNWHGVMLGGKSRILSARFMGVGLDRQTHSDVACQLVRYPITSTVAWITEASERMIAGRLTDEWVKQQEFSSQLYAACAVDIVAVMNFPIDSLHMDEVYVISFLLKRRNSVLERL